LEKENELFKFIGLLKMKQIFLYIFILSTLFVKAQDIDIYKKNINTNFDLPQIPLQMSYQEFKTLSTNLRMQDIGIAMILPGHVHFKTGEKKMGYYILGATLTGYLGMIYMSSKNQSVYKTVFYDNTIGNVDISTTDKIISYGSIILVGGSFLFDWIHGKYKLEEKQTKIRYKYAKKKLKAGFSFIEMNKKIYPSLNFKYTL